MDFLLCVTEVAANKAIRHSTPDMLFDLAICSCKAGGGI